MKNGRTHAIPILSTLSALNKKYNKLYCYPSQLTILGLLSIYHETKISIATLNRWLRDMEDNGLMIRVRRIKKHKRKGILFKSTLYKITIKGYQALSSCGVSVWREIKAITVQGIKEGERALKKFSGPVSLKTILGCTTMFGVGQKTYILDE